MSLQRTATDAAFSTAVTGAADTPEFRLFMQRDGELRTLEPSMDNHGEVDNWLPEVDSEMMLVEFCRQVRFSVA